MNYDVGQLDRHTPSKLACDTFLLTGTASYFGTRSSALDRIYRRRIDATAYLCGRTLGRRGAAVDNVFGFSTAWQGASTSHATSIHRCLNLLMEYCWYTFGDCLQTSRWPDPGKVQATGTHASGTGPNPGACSLQLEGCAHLVLDMHGYTCLLFRAEEPQPDQFWMELQATWQDIHYGSKGRKMRNQTWLVGEAQIVQPCAQ